MELFSLMGSMAAPLAAMGPTPPDLEVWQKLWLRPEMREGLDLQVLFVLATILGAILSLWFASRIMVDRDLATFGRAVVSWIAGTLLAIVYIVVLLVVCFYMASQKNMEMWRCASTLGGISLLGLCLTFFIPMKIYQTGFARILGLLVLSFVFSTFINLGLGAGFRLIPGVSKKYDAMEGAIAETAASAPESLPPPLRETLSDRIALKNETLLEEANPTGGERPNLRRREAIVRTMQGRLSAQKKLLSAGDEPRARIFKDQLDRYLSLLEDVKKDLTAETKSH